MRKSQPGGTALLITVSPEPGKYVLVTKSLCPIIPDKMAFFSQMEHLEFFKNLLSHPYWSVTTQTMHVLKYLIQRQCVALVFYNFSYLTLSHILHPLDPQYFNEARKSVSFLGLCSFQTIRETWDWRGRRNQMRRIGEGGELSAMFFRKEATHGCSARPWQPAGSGEQAHPWTQSVKNQFNILDLLCRPYQILSW